MSITLGDYTFSGPLTAVSESLEELGGRDTRAIRLQGVIDGLPTQDALEAALALLLQNASASEHVPLSLRDGRRFLVRRTAFKREINVPALSAAFTLILEAMPPYEEAIGDTTINWFFASAGATKPCPSAGTLSTDPVITLEAMDTLIRPAFGDGVRTLVYDGVLETGDALVVDGPAARVLLNDTEVTPYTQGLFPRIAAPSTTITYTDDPGSSHAGAATIFYFDRWH